jgi:aminoglycoside phosphotransferase (APT) family kinase protein
MSNANSARRVSENNIRDIWDACRLGSVRRVVPAASGSRNESYIVNDDLFIRFNTRDTEFRKFGNERAAYELLAQSAVRVPRVVALDESRTIVPYDLIVLTRLPGVNIAESKAALTQTQIRELARKAGINLALIHNLTFERFGKLRSLDFRSWRDYFADYAHRYEQAARRYSLLNDATQRRLNAVLARAQGLIDTVTRGVLVHCDFHYENILQEHGTLAGILDFEWAIAGDPACDLMTAETREAMLPGSEAAFSAGYLSVRSLDEQYTRRAEVYRLFLALETVVMQKRDGNTRGIAPAQKDLLDRLGKIERWTGA